jgi:CBS-domain-containing membrane protein
MITDRDICMAALFQGKALSELPVKDSMAKKVLICNPGQDISSVDRAMREARVRRVPVVDAQGSLVGIVGLADLAREAASERADAEKQITESEIGDTLAAICEPRAKRRLAA